MNPRSPRRRNGMNSKRRPVVPSARDSATHSSTLTSRSLTMRRSVPSRPWRITAAGVKRTCPIGSVMAAFEYRQAEEIRDAFRSAGVRYLFIGKSGAILLGFPDTTQDADLFVERTPANGKA